MKVEGTQDGHLDSQTAPELCGILSPALITRAAPLFREGSGDGYGVKGREGVVVGGGGGNV